MDKEHRYLGGAENGDIEGSSHCRSGIYTCVGYIKCEWRWIKRPDNAGRPKLHKTKGGRSDELQKRDHRQNP